MAPSGLITPTVLTMLTMPLQQPRRVSRMLTVAILSHSRDTPSFCSSSQSILTALERLGPEALILIIRAPDRPSRPNAISMSNMRR
jgi:hypothetical protein